MLSGIVLGLLASLSAFSIIMDPFGLYHSADYIPPAFNPARDISYSYVTKSAKIIEYRPDKILLGSSIVDHGFRLRGSQDLWYCPIPENTRRLLISLDPQNRDFFNAAVRGGTTPEMLAFLKHAYLNNPKLKEVVLGLEWPTLLAPPNPVLLQTTALGKRYIPISFRLEYLLSPLALLKSYKLFAQEHPTILRYTDIAEATVARVGEWFKHWQTPASAAQFSADNIPNYPTLISTPSYSPMRQFVHSVWLVNIMARNINKEPRLSTPARPFEMTRNDRSGSRLVAATHSHRDQRTDALTTVAF
jgi:hypothetical protein